MIMMIEVNLKDDGEKSHALFFNYMLNDLWISSSFEKKIVGLMYIESYEMVSRRYSWQWISGSFKMEIRPFTMFLFSLSIFTFVYSLLYNVKSFLLSFLILTLESLFIHSFKNVCSTCRWHLNKIAWFNYTKFWPF